MERVAVTAHILMPVACLYLLFLSSCQHRHHYSIIQTLNHALSLSLFLGGESGGGGGGGGER